ncbi:rCG23259, partial [Rattus norvegicus]
MLKATDWGLSPFSTCFR